MEDILAEARKSAEAAEVFTATSEETAVQFEANHLKHLQTRQSTVVALRVIKDGRIGYATGTQLSNARGLVAAAVETAQFGTPARFEFPATAAFPAIEVYDEAATAVAFEAMVGLGGDMVDRITAHTPGIICEAGVSRAKISFRLMNSRGGQARYDKTVFSLGIEGNLTNGTDMLFVGESESSCHPITDATVVTDAVTRQLDLASNRATVPSRFLPVIFTSNGVASALVLPLMAAFNGKTVLEGASPVGGKLGQPVFDARFSLRDDATLPYRPGSRPCDDEGVPSQRTALVEAGVVSSFLYDLQTAGLARTRSTGNGSRGRAALPSPSPSAFVIAPGDTTFDDMVRDIKEGLVIEQLIGAEQGNILGGDFSGNVLLGYKIEDGRMVGRVKDTMVSGNVYQLLKEVAAIGSETRWVSGFVQTPPICFPSLSVASKA
ncbi:MAG: TldD/PmbA family protein [Chloroflexi bacterium]|nr:TldD/PmbA family protein [Chloroflexota bacterium]